MNTLVRQIAVLSVLWAVCELLLPDGKHQQLVRITASLLVMTALLTTVSGWLHKPQEAKPTMTVMVQQAAENTYHRTALTAIANQLQHFCEQFADRAGFQANAEVYLTMEGAVDHIKLLLYQSKNALISCKRLVQTMAAELGINQNQIQLSVEGA